MTVAPTVNDLTVNNTPISFEFSNPNPSDT
jgi:hypothetical protein